MSLSDAIKYVGVDDLETDFFEGQYPIPDGISYNSYVIMDDKITIMDSVDAVKTEEWLKNLDAVLGDQKPEYLVISHMEPDHSGSLLAVAHKYPDMKLVGNAKTFAFAKGLLDDDFAGRQIVVKEGDTLELGSHTLQFVFAPMVHWPEVMFSYEQSEKILFTADGFGKFGAWSKTDGTKDWLDEARRYYINIVGKYGMQVNNVLKKAAALEIQTICPLHGPILEENLSYYLERYQTWASYTPEEKGVLIAVASAHGNTHQAALEMEKVLKEKNIPVHVCDLVRDGLSEAVGLAFKYETCIFAAPTYDAGIFLPMLDFIQHLKSKNYQNRRAAFIENGTWAPASAKLMTEQLSTCKNVTFCENKVSIRSSVKANNLEEMKALAEEIQG